MTENDRVETQLLDNLTDALKRVEKSVNVLDCIAELVVHHDMDLTVLWANKAARDSAGLSVNELAGRHCYEVWHQRSQPCTGCPVLETLETREPTSREMTGHRGEVRLIKAYPVREADGEVTGAVAVTTDLTDLKLAEMGRRESEAKHRDLVEQSLQAIVVIQKMRIVFANEVLAKITGFSMEEILGFGPEQVKAFVHPECQNLVWERYASRLSGKDVPPHYEFRALRKDGTIWWAEMHSNLVTYQGEPAIQCAILDITERKLAEQALRRSEEQHRSLVENINEIIFTLDTQGRFTYVSPVVERILGYQPAEIIGQPFNWFVHPDDAPGLLVAFERSFSAHNKPYEFRVIDKNGSTHFVHVSCRPVSDEGHIEGLTGIMADITESKMAGAVLKESEEMYETLVRATTDAVIVTDLQANLTQVSNRTVELFGYDTADDLVGRNWFELMVATEHQRALTNLKMALKQGFVRSTEYEVLRQDRTRFSAEVDAALIRDAVGSPKSLIITLRDITERKRAEKALRKSEQRFSDIAENASEWIWEVDAGGTYTYSNPVVEKIMGYTPQEILGKCFTDFFHPEDREQLKKAAFDTFLTKKPFSDFTNRNLHKNGKTVWLSTSGVPVLDESGELLGYRGADTDITERKLSGEGLSAERERLVSTLRAIDDGVIVADLTGTVLLMNEAALGFTGCTERDAFGKDISEVLRFETDVTEETPARILATVAEEVDNPRVTGQAVLISKDSGRKPIAYTVARICERDTDISGVAIIFKDVQAT
ncbi:MAG: PAS domain S-box protein [Candidatus Eisenbacteria bacterium]